MWGGCKTVAVCMHFVEAKSGSGDDASFTLLQSNSPFAYQACCMWEGDESYDAQKWGCRVLIAFAHRTLSAGGLQVGEHRWRRARSERAPDPNRTHPIRIRAALRVSAGAAIWVCTHPLID